MSERVPNLVDLVFLLQEKHLILVAENDCQLFPPSMKSSAFGVLMLFVVFGNFCDIFSIFEHVQSQDGGISVGKGYKSI